jgi:hypothetical protein
MKRREFMTIISGVAILPLAAGAQQPSMPVIGYLSLTSPEERPSVMPMFEANAIARSSTRCRICVARALATRQGRAAIGDAWTADIFVQRHQAQQDAEERRQLRPRRIQR